MLESTNNYCRKYIMETLGWFSNPFISFHYFWKWKHAKGKQKTVNYWTKNWVNKPIALPSFLEIEKSRCNEIGHMHNNASVGYYLRHSSSLRSIP